MTQRMCVSLLIFSTHYHVLKKRCHESQMGGGGPPGSMKAPAFGAFLCNDDMHDHMQFHSITCIATCSSTHSRVALT